MHTGAGSGRRRGGVLQDSLEGLRRFGHLLRRWRWLIIGAVLVALIVGALASASAPGGYDANAVVLIEQPGLAATPSDGAASAQELIDLMPTVSSIAVSNQVLDGVRKELGMSASVSALRSDTQVSVVPNTLTLSLTVHMAYATEAQHVASAEIHQLDLVLASIGGAGAGGVGGTRPPPAGSSRPIANRLSAVALEEPTVSAVPRHAALTIGIALLIGIAFGIAAAIVLDRS